MAPGGSAVFGGAAAGCSTAVGALCRETHFSRQNAFGVAAEEVALSPFCRLSLAVAGSAGSL
jgi:hypothetical protein